MEEFLGIAFTNRSLSLARVKEGDPYPQLLSTNEILFPFPFEFNALLKHENLEALSEKLRRFVENNSLHGTLCYVSLPMYLAQMKRAPFPQDLDHRILQKQFVWEMENISSQPLEENKVIKLKHEFNFGSYEESAFILIQKKTLQTIKQFIEDSGLKLRKMVLDSDSLLKFLQSYNLLHPAKNQIIFQIDVFSVTVYHYLDGYFFSYDLSPITEKEQGGTFEQKIIDILGEKVEKFQQMVHSLPGYEYPVEVFVTRLITDNLSKKLQEVEFKVEELTLNRVLEDNTPTKIIEPFAVML